MDPPVESRPIAAPLTCQGCGAHLTPGSEYVDLGNEKYWHERCYTCQFCSGHISGTPLVEFGRLFHRACHTPAMHRCRRCKGSVDPTAVTMAGCRWHTRCFTCALCRQPMDVDSAVFRFMDCYHQHCVGPVMPNRSYFMPDGSLVRCPKTIAVVPGSRPVLLSAWPLVVVLPDFLTPEECQHFRAAASGRMEPSRTGIHLQQPGDPKDETMYEEGRSSTSYYISKGADPIVEAVERRAALVTGVPYEHISRPHIGHYAPGQQFAIHWDASTKTVTDTTVQGFVRVRTVLVYLNTPAGVEQPHLGGPKAVDCPSPDSGHTRFPLLGFSIAPTEGCALLFQNVDDDRERIPEALHAGLPVCCGEKWVMNIWGYNKPLVNGVVPHYRPRE